MKRILILTLLTLTSIITPSKACDFCNCLYGINPFYSARNKVMLNYLAQHSVVPAAAATPAVHTAEAGRNIAGRIFRPARMLHGPAAVGTESREERKTIELSYQHFLTDRIIGTVLVPLTSMTTTTTSSRTIAGNGDITLLGHWVALEPMDATDDEDPVTLLLGGGVKLPAGDNTSRDSNGVLLDQQSQLGTGTFDLLVHILYSRPVLGVTANLDVTAKLNSADKHDSRVGHSLTAAFNGSMDIYRNNAALFGIVGFAGVRLEHGAMDRHNGIIDEASGMTSLYLQAGTQLIFDVIKVNVAVLTPLLQKRPASAPDEGTRMIVGIQYEF